MTHPKQQAAGLLCRPRIGRRHGAVSALAVAASIALLASSIAGAGPDADTPAKAVPMATLEVAVSHLASDEGVLVVALLDSPAQYEAGDSSFRSERAVPIHGGKARVVLSRVPYGTYAVKVFHDENSNGALDTNLVGFPKEGFGFSNDAMGRFGPPRFDEAAFRVDAPRHRIEITIR